MSITRRTFLFGAATGASVLVLTACVDDSPAPSPSPTSPSPSPTPSVPRPADVRRSAWLGDSFSRGSHSFLRVGSSVDDRATLGTSVAERLFFAGEATSLEAPSTLHGAQETGNRAAYEVIAVAEEGERIAVIGAGIAGATAARALERAGFDVVVIEARDRSGGRIRTVERRDWPIPVELGAGRLYTAEGSVLLEQLARLEISTEPFEPVLEGRTVEGEMADPAPVAQAALATALAWAAGQTGDVSLGRALAESGATTSADPELLDAALRTGVDTLLGADPSAVSARNGLGEVPIAPSVLVTGGLQAVIDEGLDELDVLLSSPVTRIGYDESGVSLRMATGESLSADRAVVTVPLGVLKDEGIDFEPPLPPGHLGAIAALGVGTVDTVWLRFEEPFWQSRATVWTLVGGEAEVRSWLNLEPIIGAPVLVGLVGAEAAERLEALDGDELVEALSAALEPFAED